MRLLGREQTSLTSNDSVSVLSMLRALSPILDLPDSVEEAKGKTGQACNRKMSSLANHEVFHLELAPADPLPPGANAIGSRSFGQPECTQDTSSKLVAQVNNQQPRVESITPVYRTDSEKIILLICYRGLGQASLLQTYNGSVHVRQAPGCKVGDKLTGKKVVMKGQEESVRTEAVTRKWHGTIQARSQRQDLHQSSSIHASVLMEIEKAGASSQCM